MNTLLDRIAIWWLARRRRSVVMDTTFRGGIYLDATAPNVVISNNTII